MQMPPSVYSFLASFTMLVKLKKWFDTVEYKLWRFKQLSKKLQRRIWGPHPLSHSYRFCVLTVKRPAYVDLTIAQINSLHFYNPYHVFDIICDDVCFQYLQANRSRLDYPDRVIFVPLAVKKNQSWQQSKIETLLYAIKRDAILIDADMYWYGEPLIRQWQALLFTKAYTIKDQMAEKKLVRAVFNHPEWAEFAHYVTALVYLPYSLYSHALETQLKSTTQKLVAEPYTFLPKAADREALRRLSEEIAINLVFQTTLRPDEITTLKTSDGPGNKELVQALYYGCMNQVIT